MQTFICGGYESEAFHGLLGLLADSLPDKFGTQVTERYFQMTGKNIENVSSVERLLYTGKRGMGALEYRPQIDIPFFDDELDITALVQLAADILEERESVNLKENEKLMEQIIEIGTSAGGARAKAVIAWNPETGSIRSGQIDAGDGYEHWLIKFDDADISAGRQHTKVEYAYYSLEEWFLM